MIDNDDLKNALHASMAKQILEGLSGEHRDKLLENAVVQVIQTHDFKRAIEKVAAERAADIAKRLTQSDEWVSRVEDVIRAGFEDYLVGLREAIPETLKDAFHGKQGNYGSAAPLLYCWPKKEKKED